MINISTGQLNREDRQLSRSPNPKFGAIKLDDLNAEILGIISSFLKSEKFKIRLNRELDRKFRTFIHHASLSEKISAREVPLNFSRFPNVKIYKASLMNELSNDQVLFPKEEPLTAIEEVDLTSPDLGEDLYTQLALQPHLQKIAIRKDRQISGQHLQFFLRKQSGLKALTLDQTSIKNLLFDYRGLLDHLTSLKLLNNYELDNRSLGKLLFAAPSLQWLELINCKGLRGSVLTQVRFKGLQVFKFEDSYCDNSPGPNLVELDEDMRENVLEFLCNHPDLKNLSLHADNLSLPLTPHLNRDRSSQIFRNLETLDLTNPEISMFELMKILNRASRLKDLGLHFLCEWEVNDDIGQSQINLPNLERLELEDVFFPEKNYLAFTKNMPNLQTLSITNDGGDIVLTDKTLSCLNADHLTDFTIGNGDDYSEEGIVSFLKKAQNLQRMEFCVTTFLTSKSLSSLTKNLRHLDLDRSSFNDRDLSLHLPSFTNLRDLSLLGTEVSPETVKAATAAMPLLQSLDLRWCSNLINIDQLLRELGKSDLEIKVN